MFGFIDQLLDGAKQNGKAHWLRKLACDSQLRVARGQFGTHRAGIDNEMDALSGLLRSLDEFQSREARHIVIADHHIKPLGVGL